MAGGGKEEGFVGLGWKAEEAASQDLNAFSVESRVSSFAMSEGVGKEIIVWHTGA